MPPTPAHFHGRSAELAKLSSLAEQTLDGTSNSSSVASIVGKPGVGKTTLAVRLAWELTERFDGPQLFVDLRGTDGKPLDPGDVLRGFLVALGENATTIPTQTNERSALFRSILITQRGLLILDNAANAAQIEPLLPGSGQIFTFVTSRNALVGLASTLQVSLDVLPHQDALEFLMSATGRPELAEDEHVEDVIELCGRLPLALRIIATLLCGWGNWSTAHLASSLRDESERLDRLSPSDVGVRASIGLSYRQLQKQARRIFRFLAAIPNATFDYRIAAIVTGMPERLIKRRLEDLVDLHLVERTGLDTVYTFHDLIRIFARERLEKEETQEQIAEIEVRLMKGLLPQALRAGRALIPAMRAKLTPKEIAAADKGHALRWLDREWPLIRGVIGLVAKHELTGDLILLLRDLERYVEMRELWRSWLELSKDVVDASERANEPLLRLLALVMKTYASARTHDIDGTREALERLDSALLEVADPRFQAEAMNAKGNGLRLLSDTKGALECFKKAYHFYDSMSEGSGRSICAHNIASAYRDLGQYDRAIEFYLEDLQGARDQKDHWSEAWTLNSLGGAYDLAGKSEDAIRVHSQAYEIFRHVDAHGFMSRCLHDLGIALQKKGEDSTAIRCHTFDLALCLARDDVRGASMALGRLGDLSLGQNDSRAAAFYDAAIDLSQASGDIDTAVTCLINRAHTAARCFTDPTPYVDAARSLLGEGILVRRRGALLVSLSQVDGVSLETRNRFLSDAIELLESVDAQTELKRARDLIDSLRDEATNSQESDHEPASNQP
ncbi:tetratricopeptide repeat protein [Nonomuraea sp. NEAU-A123]|uniref:ATP-binding protein n=1 Tax=Nonomuraea sp. NEAU-A123 TaxID=2839649 RepID=UPI001BE45626|nr:tetratricopeptide repeat protein [Nonomuraea sp. NEAU-A123]MBT2226041.1 tetratricopeptide repeat protein [Nonomuraea sp. NEAU-A123]